MTAPSSQHLADVLKKHGFAALAERAERDEFHDYLSPHDLPSMELDMALVALINDASLPEEQRDAALAIRTVHHEGEFDATAAESDEWAASPEGRALIGKLTE